MPELDEKYVRKRGTGQAAAASRSLQARPVTGRVKQNLHTAPAPAPPHGNYNYQDANPLRKFALLAGVGLVLLMFGTLSELTAYLLHTNTYLLYLVGPPTLVGVVITGGIGRTLQHRAAWYWLGFFGMMILATPFSSWVGGSAAEVMSYARFSFPLLFVVGGLALTWDEVRKYFQAIGLAGLITVLASRMFSSADEGGRLSLSSSGTIGNSNDLASHLVIVLPFVLFLAMDPKRKMLTRILMLGVVGYGIWVILGTASRGGLIALGVVFLFMLMRASASQRIAVLAAGMVFLIATPVLLPASVRSRLSTLFGGQNEEADESQESRSYLFQKSVAFTLQHPVFGVGPDQFSNFEGKSRVEAGEIGEWHATHCAFTQVSSECGIPALLFFLLGIGSAALAVNRTWRRARAEKFPEISRACFYYLTALVGYLATITFLANAYRFYLPAMIGLAIAISTAGCRYMDENAHAAHA